MRVFHELNWAEDLGSGTRNILRYAPLYYPDYKIEINSGTQFLFSITYRDENVTISEEMSPSLSENVTEAGKMSLTAPENDPETGKMSQTECENVPELTPEKLDLSLEPKLEASWETGRHIVEYEQHGNVKAEYGKQLLTNLSKDLTRLRGKGYSRSNLFNMRLFYVRFQKIQTVSGQLTLDNAREYKIHDYFSLTKWSPMATEINRITRHSSAPC